MQKQLQKQSTPNRRQTGFTIIEVLIVLAIAGLIMVVVFLAVPALQRNGRNNSLNSSARNILSATHTYMSNNGGTFPSGATPISLASNVVTVGSSGSNQEIAKVDNGVASVSLNGTTITATAAIGTIQVITGTSAVCNATSTGLSGTGSAKSVVVLYVAEGGGSANLLKCIG